jgi:phosphoribosylanthranilate isomerase
VRVEIKFCGLTRPEDAEHAAAVGASYVGVIFAGGPRVLDTSRAADVLAAAGATVRRVGVFGDQPPGEIARVARAVRLDVIQLHRDPSSAIIRRVRDEGGEVAIWGVVRVDGRDLAPRIAELDEATEAIVLDSFVAGRLGGTGVPFDWGALSPGARPRHARLVAAGGLTPENVREAIAAMAPHVVDVSSGVEREPGVKDHARMRAFADAVDAVMDRQREK